MFYVRKHISFILITGDFLTINSVLFAKFPVFLKVFSIFDQIIEGVDQIIEKL